MKYLYCLIVIFAIFTIGCADEALMTILSDGSDTIITAPPDEIWEATEMVREEATATIHALYNLDIDEIIALNPNHDPVQLRTDMEHRKQPIEWKLERLGITLADLDLLTLQKEFYTKYIDAAGIAILSNDSVADEHLIEARDIIIALTAKRPELRDMLSTQRDNVIHGVTTEGLQTFYGQGFYMVLIDSNTVSFADMPELFDLHPYDIWYDGSCSARGSLQSGVIGFCFAEINPTRRNGRHSLSTFTHEFGHAIHSAITKLDPTAADQIALAYAHQIGGSHLDDSDWIPENEGKKWENCYIWEGLHKGAIQGELQENPTTWLTGLYGYGGTNCHEYFAEAIELWYHGIGPGRKIESYEAFAKRDPLLSEVLEEWLPKIPLARK